MSKARNPILVRHTYESWTAVSNSGNLVFHSDTRWHLRDAHPDVSHMHHHQSLYQISLTAHEPPGPGRTGISQTEDSQTSTRYLLSTPIKSTDISPRLAAVLVTMTRAFHTQPPTPSSQSILQSIIIPNSWI